MAENKSLKRPLVEYLDDEETSTDEEDTVLQRQKRVRLQNSGAG